MWWWLCGSEGCNGEGGDVAKSVADRGEGDFDNPFDSESGK